MFRNSFRLFPGADSRKCSCSNHLGRWCRLRLLLRPKDAGSNPARNESSSSSGVERRKTPQPLVPRLSFIFHAAFTANAVKQPPGRWCRSRLLRLLSGRRKFESCLERKLKSSSGPGRLMYRSRLFPGQNIFGRTHHEGVKATTLAGGVGNGYFGSGECGFKSRCDCSPDRVV